MPWIDALAGMHAAVNAGVLGYKVHLGDWGASPNVDSVYVHWLARKPASVGHESLEAIIDVFVRAEPKPGELKDPTAARLAAYTKLAAVQGVIEASLNAWKHDPESGVVTLRWQGWTSDIGAFAPSHGARLAVHLVYPHGNPNGC